MNQHTEILELIESLRKKLQKREPFDLNELKRLLVKHKTFEEKSIYPVIDQEIDEDEKSYIIDRIKEIRL
jgi:hemerythrin superfamily protein